MERASYALKVELVWPSLVQLLGSCQEVLRWLLRSLFSQEVVAEAANVQGFVPLNLREHLRHMDTTLGYQFYSNDDHDDNNDEHEQEEPRLSAELAACWSLWLRSDRIQGTLGL